VRVVTKDGFRISRTPFDWLRTGFDTLLHYVPQLLRMLMAPKSDRLSLYGS